MKHIKKFNEAWKSWSDGDVTLVKLIDDNGNVLDKSGIAVEGDGIFDDKGGYNYMGGISEDGVVFINSEGPIGAYDSDGNEYNVKAGDIYNGQKKFDKIIKESKKNCNKEEVKCERDVCICGRR